MFFIHQLNRFMTGKIYGFYLLILLFSCKPAHYSPKSYKSSQLIIGSSGGVTGNIQEFTLLDNGHLFMSKGLSGEVKELPKVGRSTTRDFFKTAHSLGIGSLQFNHPGNITYYLILKTATSKNTVKWGESAILPPAGIKEFHDRLLSEFQH